MNWPHDDIMRRASLRTERRLAYLEAKRRWQGRLTAAIFLVGSAAVGMALAGWYLYG